MASGPVQAAVGTSGAVSAKGSFVWTTSFGEAAAVAARLGRSIWTRLVTGWVSQLVLNRTTVCQLVRFCTAQLVT